MLKRSLKASPAGIIKAKQAFARKQWSQEYLAAQVGLSTRNSVWKFFAGRPIERHIFLEICFQLDLDWQEIADLPDANPQPSSQSPSAQENLASQDWIQQLKGQIQAQCGIVQSFFDVNQPLKLDRVYTDVNVLTSLSNQQWLEVSDLQTSSSVSRRFDLFEPNRKTISALDAITSNSRLVILGKPGSGKTTFLQHLALLCIEGKFKADCLPIFISLRIFATQVKETRDFSLANYISRTWGSYGISSKQVETLIRQGKVLILLDGLEEISPEDSEPILAQIQQFAEVYYQNAIAITCRIGIQAYPLRGFTYVELADWNLSQVETFVQKWFVATNRESETEGLAKAAQFLELLKRPENLPILELAVTPILLSLLCSVFQARSSFPAKRSKLYQEALEILLGRWDRSRGIQREQTYYNLSLPDKIKLFSQIAATTFEQGNYFFEGSDVQNIIADYLLALPQVNPDPEILWSHSEELLHTIERQHGLLVERAKGIYSFSHLTFQEYLTARKIVASPNSQTLQESLQRLAIHVAEPQWREVIFLTVGMLPSADFLLEQMKVQVDSLLAAESRLEQFIRSIDEKARSLNVPYQNAAVRAFYFGLLQSRDLNLATSLDVKLASDLAPELALDVALIRAFTLSLTLLDRPELEQILELSFALDLERRFPMEEGLKQALQDLKDRLPNSAEGLDSLQTWWKTNGQSWCDRFRHLIIKHRHIGQDWQFNLQQQNLLYQYYAANQFLVDCLNNQCQVDPVRREGILETLLLL
ncbi:MAG: NACHT domain-containing NTPase [Hydrococcus sp. C42_A2020_068]|nr:NACHT domain-containing NTPase [Hydrococcus sp. C42_A2020_068]